MQLTHRWVMEDVMVAVAERASRYNALNIPSLTCSLGAQTSVC